MRSVEITSPSSHTDFYADFDPIEPQQVASPLIRNVMRQLNCLSPALCRFSCCCCCCWSTHAMRSHRALSYLWGKSSLLWITIQSQVYLLSYSLEWSTHWVKRSLCLERQLIFVLSALIIDLLSSTDLQVICVTDQHQNRSYIWNWPLIRWSFFGKAAIDLIYI